MTGEQRAQQEQLVAALREATRLSTDRYQVGSTAPCRSSTRSETSSEVNWISPRSSARSSPRSSSSIEHSAEAGINERATHDELAQQYPSGPEVERQQRSSSERELNTAIVSADISASYEEFLAIVDQFYTDDVDLRSDSSPEPLIGRARLKSLLVGFLVPVHIMAEIGGLSVSVSERPIAGDSRDEQHSQWSVELVGVTGRAVRVSWSVRRRWKQSRVVSEYHYDHHQEGEALGLSDLRIPTFNGMEESNESHSARCDEDRSHTEMRTDGTTR